MENVPAPRESIFTLSRASKLPYNAKSKHNNRKHITHIIFTDVPYFSLKGIPYCAIYSEPMVYTSDNSDTIRYLLPYRYNCRDVCWLSFISRLNARLMYIGGVLRLRKYVFFLGKYGLYCIFWDLFLLFLNVLIFP